VNVEDALEDEIAFWQSLIDHQREDTPREVLERMAQARALAEHKLRLASREPVAVAEGAALQAERESNAPT
jgi:hypothetical protein